MHQPTVRVLRVLEYMARTGSGQRLTDLSRALKIPQSTLTPVLETLCADRYLSRDECGRYSRGPAMLFQEAFIPVSDEDSRSSL